jgi:hypothetical protein
MKRILEKNSFLPTGALIVSFWPGVAFAQPAPPHREHVRFSYRVPEGCPSESDFLDLVRTRDAEIIADDEAARTLSIAITFDEKWRASLQTEGIANGKATRTIDGDSCEGVAKSIAIFTAIALREGSPDELPPAHPELAEKESLETPEEGFMPMAPPPPRKPRRYDYDLHSGRIALTAKESFAYVDDGGKHLGTGVAVTYFPTAWLGVDLEGALLFNLPADELEPDRNLPRAKLATHVEFEMLRAWGSLYGPHRGNVIDLFLKLGLGVIWTHPDSQYFDFYAHQSHDTPQILEDSALGMRIFFTDSLALVLDTGLEAFNERITQDPNQHGPYSYMPDRIAYAFSIDLGLAWFPIAARGWRR